MKTIGYVSESNPFVDRKAWSGTIYKIREAIEQAGYNVVWVPVRKGFLYFLIIKLQRLFYGKNSIRDFTDLSLRILMRGVKTADADRVDCLFFPGGAQITKFWNIKVPAIYYTDATYHQMLDYYWKEQPKRLIDKSEANEQIACDNCALIIKPSQWATDSTISDYHQDPKKCVTIEFGANLDDKDVLPISPYIDGEFYILFSGVEWTRKRADIAIDATKLLNDRGIKARLFLVGLVDDKIPIKYKRLPYVEYVGFLNKNEKEQYDKYVYIVSKSHILLLPTVAECAGIVFCEAAAYGLPVFTFNTGGVGNYVIDGENGYKLPLSSTAKDFADRIELSILSAEFYKLSHGALKLYEEKLSWKAWSKEFKKVMQERGM